MSPARILRSDAWDAHPQIFSYPPGTLPREWFGRGALAHALNRSTVTIRMWERNDIFCHPPTKNTHGHWIYTREQIEDLVKLAQEEGILQFPDRHLKISERFKKEAKRILRRDPREIRSRHA